MHCRLGFGLVLALGLWSVDLIAQPPVDTVTIEQRVLLTPDLTPAEARRRAIEGALAEAVRQRVGVRVQAGAMSVTEEQGRALRDSWVSVVQLDAAGRAVDYRVLDEEYVTTRHSELGSQVYVRVRVLASVARDAGNVDPGFSAGVSVGEPVYHDRGGPASRNDEVVARLTASREAWLTLIGIADDSVTVLAPNDYVAAPRVAPGDSIEFPPREWRERGLRFRVTLPRGRDARRELLMVIATRAPVRAPFRAATVLELQRWLVTLPLDQRAIGFAPYEVRRAER
jgi:hypothetical protein